MVKAALKKVGAWLLTIAIMLPMLTMGLAAPAQATAGGRAASATGQPRLFIDYLGDNKTGADWTALPGTPAAADQNANTSPGSNTWTGYNATNAKPVAGAGTGTIFWVGIGLDQVDSLVLAKDGKGIYSAELAFYYNSAFVEPYAGSDFKTVLAGANLTATPGTNQWDSDLYQIDRAYAGVDPANPPVGLTVNDPATEEHSPESGWNLVYASIERKPESTGTNRFADGSATTPKYENTQYLLMVPFVLKQIDTANQAVCFRQARNGSVFTLGGGTDGAAVYGAWEKNTAANPEHNLKLMLDFMGDLNIWTGLRETDTHTATFRVEVGGNSGNTATMRIAGDKTPKPIVADGLTVTQIPGVGGGKVLAVHAAPLSGYKEIKTLVTNAGGKDITAQVMPLAGGVTQPDGSRDYNITMPEEDITVTVTFVYDGSTVVDYTAFLQTTNAGNDPKNIAKMSYTDSGNLTHTTDPTKPQAEQILKLPAGKSITLDLAMNTDYNVVVTAFQHNTSAAITCTEISTTLEKAEYRITMPANDIDVKVEFVKATQNIAKLKVEYAPNSAPTGTAAEQQAINEKNSAKMSYTKSDSTVDATDAIYPAISVTPPPKDSLTLRDKRVVNVKISDTHDSAYRVRGVTVTKTGDAATTVLVTRDGTDLNLYTFTMPAFPVDVAVTYEKAPLYTTKLVVKNEAGIIDTAKNKAKISGTDARGTHQADETQTDLMRKIETLEGTKIIITPILDASTGAGSYTVEVKRTVVTAGNLVEETITPDKEGATYTFSANKLPDPATDFYTVTVHFQKALESTYWAKLDATSVNPGNVAAWTGGIVGAVNKPLKAGDKPTAEITVAAGQYIQRVSAFVIAPPTKEELSTPELLAAAVSAQPFVLGGNGYNNGLGGKVSLSFMMPKGNVLLQVTYGAGPPVGEPEFIATLLVTDGYTPPDTGVSTPPVHSASLSNARGSTTTIDGGSVSGTAGEFVTGSFRAAAGYYILGIVVTADAPTTPVSWHYTKSAVADPPTEIKLTLPAANVAVAVTFCKDGDPIPPPVDGGAIVDPPWAGAYDLTLQKTEATASADNRVESVVVDGGAPILVTGALPQTLSTKITFGRLVRLNLACAAGQYISAVTVLDESGKSYAVALDNAAKTAEFVMPGRALTATVHFNAGTPPPPTQSGAQPLTLTVTGPSFTRAAGSAYVEVNGIQTSPATLNNPISTKVQPGDRVRVIWTGANGGPVTVTPAELGIVPLQTGPAAAEFTMPPEPVAVVVPFQTEAMAYTANLVLRGPNGKDVATMGSAKFSSVDGAAVLPGQEQALSAPPGAALVLDLAAADGAYISSVEVTPAYLGVEAKFTGSLAQQSGQLTMPAANITVVVTLAEGWTPALRYTAALSVQNAEGLVGAGGGSGTLSHTGGAVTAAAGDPTQTLSGLAEGELVTLALTKPNGIWRRILTITDPMGRVVPYTQTQASPPATEGVRFVMPAGNVKVAVQYRAEPVPSGTANLHVSGTANDSSATASLKNETTNNTVTITSPDGVVPISAAIGDKMTITASTTNADKYLDAVFVLAGGQLLPLTPVYQQIINQMKSYTGSFIMPEGTAEVYLSYADGRTTQPAVGSFAAALTLTRVDGRADTASQALLSVTAPPAGEALPPVTAVTAKAGQGATHLVALPGSILRVDVTPDTNVTIREILLTPAGCTKSSAVPFHWVSASAAEFAMPAEPVAVEVLLEAAVQPKYRAQIVVRNEANGGVGQNSATLNRFGMTDNAKLLTGLSTGDTVELAFLIAAGYQVGSVNVVPAGNTPNLLPDPSNQSTRKAFQMPACDVVIYVDFVTDTHVNYNATLHIVNPLGGNGTAELKSGTNPPASTNLDGGKIAVPAGVALTLTGTPDLMGQAVGSAFYMEGDKLVPLTLDKQESGKPSVASFPMPGADIDVHVIFRADDGSALPDWNLALLMVTGPVGTALGAAGSATLQDKSFPSATVTMQSSAPAEPIPMGHLDTTTGKLLTLTIAPEPGYQVDTVTSSGSTKLQVSPTDPNVYTFTMPNTDVAIHVTLKKTAGYTLTLHTGQAAGETVNAANTATMTYTADGVTKTATAASGSTAALTNVPEMTEMTLRVEPAAGTTVLAAYALAQGKLLPLQPALEGKTNSDAVETRSAKFAVPAANADVYVLYTKAPPAAPWQNLIVLAGEVDAQGKPIHLGKNRVTLKSTTLTPGKAVQSDGKTSCFTLPKGETVQISAPASKGYAFQSIAALRSDNIAITPTQPDATLRPEDYQIVMPNDSAKSANVGVTVTYGASGSGSLLDVTLTDSENTGNATNAVKVTALPPANPLELSLTSTTTAGAAGQISTVTADTTVTLTVTPGTPSGGTPYLVLATLKENAAPPAVNHALTLFPTMAGGTTYLFPMPATDALLDVSFVSGYKATLKVVGGTAGDKASMTIGGTTQEVLTGGEMSIGGLKGEEPIALTQTPTAGSEVRAVLLTNSDGSVMLPDKAATTMQKQNITITVFFDTLPADLYVATVSQTKVDNDVRNTIDITNLDAKSAADGTTDPPSGDIWAAAKEGDRMHISFTTAPGVFVKITAGRSAARAAELEVLQVGTTGRGDAYLTMPASNVAVVATYGKENPFPNPIKLDVAMQGHGNLLANTLAVTGGDTALNLNGKTPTGYVTAIPGTVLTLQSGFAAGYRLKSAQLIGGNVKTDVLDALKAGTLAMPTVAASLAVTYVAEQRNDLAIIVRDEQNTGALVSTITAAVGSQTATATSKDKTGASTKLTAVLAGEGVSFTITPDALSAISAVIATTASGGSELLKPSPAKGRAAGAAVTYTYTMPAEAASVTVVLGAQPPYTVTVKLQGVLETETNASIENTTNSAYLSEKIWVQGVENDAILVKFATTNAADRSRYVKATVVTEKTARAVDFLQLGTTETGTVRFKLPAENVTVTLAYAETPPVETGEVTLVSSGHGGVAANAVTLKDSKTPTPGTATLTPNGTDIMDLTTKIPGLLYGSKLTLTALCDPLYHVEKVSVTAGNITAELAAEPDGSWMLPMPSAAAVTLTVTYGAGAPTPRPYDPANAEDPAHLPPLQKGYLKAVPASDRGSATITVPLLYGGMSTATPSTPIYHDAYTAALVGPPASPEYKVTYALYTYDETAKIYSKLEPVTEYTLVHTAYPTSTVDGKSYTGETLTLTPISAAMNTLLAEGGLLHLTATQATTPIVAESGKTQLLLPPPENGPRPYDPDHDAEGADLPKGWLGSVNMGEYLIVTVPTLAMPRGTDEDLEDIYDDKETVPETDDLDSDFKLYWKNGADYVAFAAEEIDLAPVDPETAKPGERYNRYSYSYTPQGGAAVTYVGAQFKVTPKAGANTAGATALRSVLATSAVDNTTLHLTAQRKGPGAVNPKESRQMPVQALPAYSLAGTLISYAPTHEAELRLYHKTAAEYDATPLLTLKLQQAEGTGRWTQDFALKSSQLKPGETYKLVIEKPGHLTYEHLDITLTAAEVETDKLTFKLASPAELLMGDADGDGFIGLSDLDRLMRYLRDPPTDPNYLIWADLDGDGKVTLSDSDLLRYSGSMGSTKADYGSPSGLKFTPPARLAQPQLSPEPPQTPPAPVGPPPAPAGPPTDPLPPPVTDPVRPLPSPETPPPTEPVGPAGPPLSPPSVPPREIPPKGKKAEKAVLEK